MKADAIADARPASPRGARGQLEHRAGAGEDAGRAKGAQLLDDGDHAAFSIHEDRVDGVPHPEAVNRSAWLDPQALSFAERRAEEEAEKPRETGARHADAVADPRARGLVFRGPHGFTLP